ncbi:MULTISPECIES: fimbrial protein [Pseudomonas aeruginosa group]|uniref:fimbrial protein n=1 Tax=Pseudomonas aeruginosa group TaxID=136841 RepID=UPI00210E602D|nr:MULTISPECIES: fimbrial protein [Pseudomonas aeruginosa group]MCW8026917.1 type 1 fimbrial protein [Pseudomonas aeruginosa]MDY1576890.1 fimbrial protein [Pseudomonas paraeruginosa]UYT20295.1 hypothetical protein OBG92_02453 [Pseudomonas aeruginosa]
MSMFSLRTSFCILLLSLVLPGFRHLQGDKNRRRHCSLSYRDLAEVHSCGVRPQYCRGDGYLLVRRHLDGDGREDILYHSGWHVIYVGTTAAGPGKYDTYPTPVAGVGFRIRGGINPDAWWPQYHDEPTSLTYNLNAATNFTIELVKTGNTTAAGQIIGELGYTVALNENLIARRIMVNGSIPIRPRVPTCKLQTPRVSVNFGQLDMSEVILEAQSSFRSFELKLLCAGGETGTRTKMFVTFTAAVNPTNTSDVLSLSSGSTATGVGIQIRRDDNTAIKFGPDSTAANNVNQWKVGENGNVEVTIPLKAGYKKTGQKVTAGTANGTATFTFSYQ